VTAPARRQPSGRHAGPSAPGRAGGGARTAPRPAAREPTAGRATVPAGQRSRVTPVLHLVGRRSAAAPRTPFVLLVLAVLGGGLVVLLLLNSASAAASFRLRRLEAQANALTLREQELSREVAAMEAPAALAASARKLGLVDGGAPGFLVLDRHGHGRVVGSPVAATSPAPPPSRPASSRPTPTAAGGRVAASPTPTTAAVPPPRPTRTPTPTAGPTR
jgi:hypothetical protein